MKLKLAKRIKDRTQWIIFDGIRSLSYDKTPDIKPGSNDPYPFTIGERQDNPPTEFLRIFVRFLDDMEQTILTKQDAFILNDEGKTIERIN